MGKKITLNCRVKSYLPLTSENWQKMQRGHLTTNIKPNDKSWRNGIWKITIDVQGERDAAIYSCIVSNPVGSVESQTIQITSETITSK